MASRSSIAALLHRRSAAARLPASGETELLPSSASASRSAVPAASSSSSSPATRASPAFSILKPQVRVRERGVATGGPVRGYHVLSASASREALPALRAPRATLSSLSAAIAGISKYKAIRLGLTVVAVVTGACLFKRHQDLEALKQDLEKLKQDVEVLKQDVEALKQDLEELKRRVNKLEEARSRRRSSCWRVVSQLQDVGM